MTFFYHYYACLTENTKRCDIYLNYNLFIIIYLNNGEFTDLKIKKLFRHGHIFEFLFIYSFRKLVMLFIDRPSAKSF